MKEFINYLNFVSYLSFPWQILYWLIISIFAYIYMRCSINGLIRFYYSNSAKKKLKKNQSVKEWFTYSKFKKIPKWVVNTYFVAILMHIIALVFFLVFRFVESTVIFSGWFLSLIAYIDGISYILIAILYWTTDGSIPYNRWFKK